MKKIVNRNNKEVRNCDLAKSQSFLYNTTLGRIILKFLVRPFVSKLGGLYMNSKMSKGRIDKFVKENNINLNDYDMTNINCYNDFFTRKLIPGKREINFNENVLISPCDSKLSVYKIDNNSIFNIKDSFYRVSDLVNNEELAKEYIGGYCLIFRLTVDDYHRYCYVDSGTKSKNYPIKGIFHTVNPIALDHYNIYKRNHREYTILNTNNFGKVVQIEVGALMVGKIKNHHEEYTFTKGEEKGMFLFGGSTIVLLVDKNIKIDDDIIANSLNGDETVVKYGEGIALYEKN
ncbi:MAG: phosphatidylserine decarboxylase [Anaeroplasmataceae bacterium]